MKKRIRDFFLRAALATTLIMLLCVLVPRVAACADYRRSYLLLSIFFTCVLHSPHATSGIFDVHQGNGMLCSLDLASVGSDLNPWEPPVAEVKDGERCDANADAKAYVHTPFGRV